MAPILASQCALHSATPSFPVVGRAMLIPTIRRNGVGPPQAVRKDNSGYKCEDCKGDVYKKWTDGKNTSHCQPWVPKTERFTIVCADHSPTLIASPALPHALDLALPSALEQVVPSGA